MGPDVGSLSADDRRLLERLAERVVELRMETPAILALESVRPVTLLASQALLFFEPFVRPLFGVAETRRLAALVERREALDALVRMIEDRVDARARSRTTPTSPDPPPPTRT